MEKSDLSLEISWKRGSLHYQTGTLYTTSPKYFMKYYLCNEVEECGVYLSGSAISKSGDVEKGNTNAVDTQEKDLYVSVATAHEAINKYKTALKVINVEKASRIHTAKEIWQWIREDVVDIDKSNITTFGLIWLFSNKSVGYTAWLATLCLLCNMNLYEVINMVRATFIKGHRKELLETEVWEMGLSDLIYTPIKKEELKLYMKIKDGNFKFE